MERFRGYFGGLAKGRQSDFAFGVFPQKLPKNITQLGFRPLVFSWRTALCHPFVAAPSPKPVFRLSIFIVILLVFFNMLGVLLRREIPSRISIF